MQDGASHHRAVRVRHVRRPHELGPRPGHLRHRGASTKLGRPPDGPRDLHRHVHRRIRPRLGQDHRPRKVRVCSIFLYSGPTPDSFCLLSSGTSLTCTTGVH